MATWNSDNIILTKLGEQVLSKVQSGVGKLTVSRIVSGAGHVSPAQLYSQTQITDIKQEMSVVKYTTNEQQSVISANLTNTGLEEAYDLYQIGIYVTHPDFTDEVLYLIAQCDSPDHIPLPGDNPVTLSYDLVMAHFGTKEVTINVSEAGHVDVTTFNEFIEKTNTALNRKADLSDIPTTLPANGGNADTVDGKHAYEFSQIVDYGDSPTSTNTVPPSSAITIYRCSNWTDYPDGASDGKGILIVACYKGFGFVGASDMWVRQLYITSHNNYKIWQRVITDTTVGEWTNIADGGNADTVNGRSTIGNTSLIRYDCLSSATDANTLISTGIYRGIITNYPSGARDGQGTLVVINYLEANNETTGRMGDTTNRWIKQWFITPHTNDVYCRSCVGTSVSDWIKINDGGNADTLDGIHASDITLSYVRKYKPTVTSVVLLDSAVKLKWLPVDNAIKYAVSLYNGRDYTTYFLDITSTEYTITGLSNGTEYQFLVQAYVNGKWNNFDKSDHIAVRLPSLATDTVAGLVSTGTQQFAGYKIFPTQIAIKTAGTVGTQPTSDINSRMFFTNTGVDAQFGEVRNCIRGSSITTGEVFTSIHAFSNDHTGSNFIKVVATDNNSGNYVSIGDPTVASSVSCLRKLASGTASANTTNCPSGAWYGKHS